VRPVNDEGGPPSLIALPKDGCVERASGGKPDNGPDQ
jgi:hypothetical protein